MTEAMSMKKYAVLMNLPEGKLAGYYAQIVKALANRVQLFDRDKEMLIIDTEADRSAVAEVLQRYNVPYEHMELLLLPEDAHVSPAAADYGVKTRLGRHYLYAHLVAVFRLAEGDASPDKPQALMQMEEHLIAKYTEGGTVYYVVDKQLEELITGIGEAYRCAVEFVDVS